MYSVLVVDDNKTNLQVLKQLLTGKYNVIPVLSGRMAVNYVKKQKPDIILLDLLMPEMDGIMTMNKIRECSNGKEVPIIFLTADTEEDSETKCLRQGAADFISKPFVPAVMITRIEKILELERLKETFHEKLNENARQLEETALQSFLSIATTIDSRDIYRKDHMQRVAYYSVQLSKELGFPKERIRTMGYCGLVYDIGNIQIPDILFLKQRKLTPKEHALMIGHTTDGAEILKDITGIEHIKEAALMHHERWDGTGYPGGLKEEEIPIEARIINIADAYVAMTSERAYRTSYSKMEACKEIKKAAGSQFDPMLAEAFLAMIEKEKEEKITAPLTSQMYSEESGLLMKESNLLLKRVLEQQNHVINSMSSLDPLTELHNRKYLEMKVCTYLAEEMHEGCFCMVDVDNFKYVNDQFGHQAGDVVLQRLGAILRANARDTDIVCRMGGDEFAIFFEGLTNQEIIRQKVEKISQQYRKISLQDEIFANTSLSIGISITVLDGRKYEELYQKADESLYYGKQNGKNCIHFSGVKEEMKENTGIAIAAHDIMELLDEKEYKKGAYKVTYSDFQRIYHFLSRSVERTKQNVQLMLLTIQPKEEGPEDLERMEDSILVLEQGIMRNLRRADVSTRYSSCQYIVILLDTNAKDASRVIERILAYYKDNMADPEYEVVYDVAQVHK